MCVEICFFFKYVVVIFVLGRVFEKMVGMCFDGFLYVFFGERFGEDVVYVL